MIQRTVSDDQAGQRVDKYLRKLFSEVPQSHIFKLLRLRRVRVNGRRAHGETLLAAGDVVTVRAPEEKLLAPLPSAAHSAWTAAGPPLQILLEDNDLLAVNKPAGLAVHPGSGIEGDTLVELVRRHAGPKEAGVFLASPAHRLDRDTSGIVLVAKTRKAMVRLTELFTAGSPEKRYLALVKGRLGETHGTIDLPLAEHEQTSKSRGLHGVKLQHAVTHWKVLAEIDQVSLLACRIETGRTHQIRRHLAAIGHPVVGDRRHGDFAFNRVFSAESGLRRMFLHAETIAFEHPISGAPTHLRVGLPRELVDVLHRVNLPVAE